MHLSRTAKQVLEERYLLKDKEGNLIETPDEMVHRIAHAVAHHGNPVVPEGTTVEELEQRFIQLMCDGMFLPNSPTLMNAGIEGGQLSACFVLPIDDSMESIFDTLKTTALIHKTGGGTGFSFSRLRSKKSSVGSTNGVASGPVSFMRVYDAATEVIKQGGKRRGANMGILRVDHPDIMEFINVKQTPGELTNFNISVAITDTFMRAYKTNTNYELVDPRTHEVVEYLNAREVFDALVKCAWTTGDPGVIFIDTVNESNTVPELGDIEATNPCGEQPLFPWESCNLGSINLSKFVTENKTIDYDALKGVIYDCVLFLDNVIDLNCYPYPEISIQTLRTRKIGLGIMGWADLLLLLGIRYGSEKSMMLAEEVMKFVNDTGFDASVDLGSIRGSFPAYDLSIFAEEDSPVSVRNAAITTIAPTGTLSIIADCSSGIEPIFNYVYTKTILNNQAFHIINPVFVQLMADNKIELTTERLDEIATKGSVKDCKWIPNNLREILVTAFDVTPAEHLKMQAAFQMYTQNAVSKTINLPTEATEDDIKEIYLSAYESRIKGITVFRYGCKEGVFSLKTEVAEEKVIIDKTLRKPRKRPETTIGVTKQISTGCGKLYVTINRDEIGFCEVFASMGKAGGCAQSQLEGTMRMASLALRVGADPEEIIDQLAGIRCPQSAFGKGAIVYSCADGISKVVESILLSTENDPTKTHSKTSFFVRPCPNCGGSMESDGNCSVCRSCGHNLCG